MKKATRQLLKYLQQANPEAYVVNVKPLAFDAAKENQCFENVMRFLDENEDWVLRSGWLVGNYFGTNGTAVMPHYWVYNPSNKLDYEITPFADAQSFEYVLDLEIAGNIDEFAVELDREKAIGSAISKAKPGDVVLIAGKGHEKVQIFGSSELPFDDVAIAQKNLYLRKAAKGKRS